MSTHLRRFEDDHVRDTNPMQLSEFPKLPIASCDSVWILLAEDD